jgi:hypothetical protein
VDWFGPTWAIYRNSVTRAARLAVRNWAVPATIPLYLVVLAASASASRYLGFAGGFLNALVWAACAGSFLSLVETIVRTNKVTWVDLRNSIGAYLGEVLGVMFFLWIVDMALSRLVLPAPNGFFFYLVAELLLLVFFNPVPELIYLGRHTLPELLAASYAFIAENWLEWFPFNIVLFVVFAVLRAQSGGGLVLLIAEAAVTALFFYFLMIARGFLFLELHGTTRRSRSFRYRAGQ